MNLADKKILITGASDGIGNATALRLAKEGVVVVCLARNEKKLQEVCEQAMQNGAKDAIYYVCDVSDVQAIESTINAIKKELGGIDVLINNAGIRQKLSPLEAIDPHVVDSVIQTNLTGLIHCTRLCLPLLKQQEEAAIINISSKAGVVAQEGLSVYTASKYGVRGFTEVLKSDLVGSNVRVAGVYQSGTSTQMFNKTGENFPIEKFTKPEDLADVIAYMLGLPEKIWLHDVRVQY